MPDVSGIASVDSQTAPVATALRRIMGVKLTDQTAAAVASVTESAPRNDTVTARFT
ncbi:hypothetical protein [Gemmatimonas sp.]|uniref:hypothetical protein n=1 Tax=Gemmatimonas sp. TaxID=1962908 RepID=UPI00286B8FF5|nr:hypothetical protein [Gemmatimonas sp.]